MDLYRLNSSTFTSDPITHSRLKSLSSCHRAPRTTSRGGSRPFLRRGALEVVGLPQKEMVKSREAPQERPCSRMISRCG